MNRIPTARNVDHTGFVVPELGAAITFFVDVLGAELAYTTDWMRMPPSGATRLAMLRVGPITNVELIENLPQSGEMPGRRDIGSPHLAFYVDDIDKAMTYLTERGAEVAGPPATPEHGPVQGETFVYFMAPWGTWMELRSHPNGLAYERETDVRTCGPAPSWDADIMARAR